MTPDPVRELHDLTAVHKFYIPVLERHLGHEVPVPHGIVDGTEIADVATESIAALKRWLDLLDLAITFPMVRDALKDPGTQPTAAALLRYYVSKHSKLASDRDKTDYVVTFLWRCRAPEVPRSAAHGKAGHLPDYGFNDLEEHEPVFEPDVRRMLGAVQIPQLPEEHRQLVREFHFIRQEVEDFRHFDELMDSGVVQRVRDIKQAFGPSFYHPHVLATVAEYNGFFGARFHELFHATTDKIKSYAARVQQEGASIMSRVEGDVIVKHLAEVEEDEIMRLEYGRAQDAFRRISKMKKAVDARAGTRPASAPPAPAPSPVPPPVEPASQAAAPSAPPDRNPMEEGKLQGTQDAIHNFMRAARPDSTRIVPLPHGNVALTTAEAEAFRANYGTEKSFRADYANALCRIVALLARMAAELQAYQEKHKSEYLWKPHSDSLAYLLGEAERIAEACSPIIVTAQQRGLAERLNALNVSLQKLSQQSQEVAQLLGGMA